MVEWIKRSPTSFVDVNMETYLQRTFSHILKLRQFASNAEIIAALQPGEVYWQTCTWHKKPDYIADMGLVIRQARSTEFGNRFDLPVIVYRPNLTCEKTRISYVSDMQSTLGKAVFTDERQAQRYFEAVKNSYDLDKIWQRSYETSLYMEDHIVFEEEVA